MRFIAILLFIPLFFACSKKVETVSTAEIYPSVVEIVSPDSAQNNENILAVLEKHGVSKASIYQWKNHLIVYDIIDSAHVINDALSAMTEQFSEIKIKRYEIPFYIFDRKKCDSKETVKEWNNIIMTANLVEDPELQQEYMDHHATQFEQWPEVAKGFCNASFQQLLVFRDERQLMLVISIPKGEDLDVLNPKTTENNPRVDEWNLMMAKYQEGINGTSEGETWVMLTP